MLRTAGLAIVCIAAVLAGYPAGAQETAPQRSTPRSVLQRTMERAAQDARIVAPRDSSSSTIQADRRQQATERTGERSRTPTKPPTLTPKITLAQMGASSPYDYSANGTYVVAALRDGTGLALWDAAKGRRLVRLDNSRRRYSLVAISHDGSLIAAARRDNSGQIDLWRGDNGRHLRVISDASAPIRRIRFEGSKKLHVLTAKGDGLVFSVPAGVAIGGSKSAAGGSATTRPSVQAESPTVKRPTVKSPAASSTPPDTRPTRPTNPTRPPVATATPKPPVRQTLPYHSSPAAPRTSTSETPTFSNSAPTPTFNAPGRALTRPPVAVEPGPRASPGGVFAPGAPALGESALPMVEEPIPSLPDKSTTAAPETHAITSPDGPTFAMPDEPAPTAAAPHEVAEEAAEPAAETSVGSAAPQGDDGTIRFDFEAGKELPADTGPADAPTPAATAAPAATPAATAPSQPAETPPLTSVNVHFATNRNRLAPKDRQWLTYFLGFFGSLPAVIIYALVILALLILPWFGKRSWGALAVLAGALLVCVMGSFEAFVRSQLRDEMTGERYGCRPTDLSYGICEISVPPPENRRPGELNRPVSVWVFEAPENPEKHFMLRRVEEHRDKETFYRSLSARLVKSDAGAALLFIHGYNVSFEDAVFRTAQLAVDLKFAGAPVAFCWPSYADPVKYTFDEQNAEVSIPALKEVLDDLADRSGAKRIHIIAHSMGNRVLAGALRSMDPARQERNKDVFRELVLAAPDIDRRVFESQVLPHIARNTGHCTLYASSRDRALLMSRCFHNYQRLGETQPDLLVTSGMDTIDASLVDTSLLGHSYIGDVQSIVSDLHQLVVGGKRPTERIGLELLELSSLRYWSIKPQVQMAVDRSLRR